MSYYKSLPGEALLAEPPCVMDLAFLHHGVVCLLLPYRLCFDTRVHHLPSSFASAELVLA